MPDEGPACLNLPYEFATILYCGDMIGREELRFSEGWPEREVSSGIKRYACRERRSSRTISGLESVGIIQHKLREPGTTRRLHRSELNVIQILPSGIAAEEPAKRCKNGRTTPRGQRQRRLNFSHVLSRF